MRNGEDLSAGELEAGDKLTVDWSDSEKEFTVTHSKRENG